MPKLFALSGPDTGRRFDVADGSAIGRAVECAVQLHDASVSRQHARIERSDGGWRIVDAGSRNGVRVRGDRVGIAPLRDGDEFQVGEVLLRFRSENAEPPAEPPPEPSSGPPARAAAPVAALREGDLDEITLEEDPVESAPLPVAETRTFAPPLPTAPLPQRAEPSRAPAVSVPRPGEPVQRGQRVLQYQRVQAREGFFASDLGQHSAWVRIAVGLLALAVFAAIFFVAFRGTSFLKSRASGGPETPADGAPADAPPADENG